MSSELTPDFAAAGVHPAGQSSRWRTRESVDADPAGPRAATRPRAFEVLLARAAAPAATPARPRACALADAAEALLWHRVSKDEARGTTAHELAVALGYSSRALQLAFAQTLGIGVASYLRLVQLHLSHEALKRGESGTVSSVAMRYGLWHFGRFSVQYRKAFGESPSVTLRRARSDALSGAARAA